MKELTIELIVLVYVLVLFLAMCVYINLTDGHLIEGFADAWHNGNLIGKVVLILISIIILPILITYVLGFGIKMIGTGMRRALFPGTVPYPNEENKIPYPDADIVEQLNKKHVRFCAAKTVSPACSVQRDANGVAEGYYIRFVSKRDYQIYSKIMKKKEGKK